MLIIPQAIIVAKNITALILCSPFLKKNMAEIVPSMNAKITNVSFVPNEGMVKKVGTKVPIIEPIVWMAESFPVIFPVSLRSDTANFTRQGVVIPISRSGGTNRSTQDNQVAKTKKAFEKKNPAIKAEKAITYFPSTGIAESHTPEIPRKK